MWVSLEGIFFSANLQVNLRKEVLQEVRFQLGRSGDREMT